MLTFWTFVLLLVVFSTRLGHKSTTRMIVGIRRTYGRKRKELFKTMRTCVATDNLQKLTALMDDMNVRTKMTNHPGGNKNETLLMVAIKYDRSEMVHRLLSWNANPEVTTKTGNNILHCMARSSSIDVVRWLHGKAMETEQTRDTAKTTPTAAPATPAPPATPATPATPAAPTAPTATPAQRFSVTWQLLRRLAIQKNLLGKIPSDLIKHDDKNVAFNEVFLGLTQRAQTGGKKLSVAKEKYKTTAMYKFLLTLNVEHHYSGLVADGWTTMERLTLIDDRDELKSAGFKLPGEIKLLLKMLEKERELMKQLTTTSSTSGSGGNSGNGGNGAESNAHNRPRSSTTTSTTSTASPSSFASSPTGIDRSELSIDYSELSIVTMELGRGSYGIVHRCKWRGMDVAVKCLIKSESIESQHEVSREANMMRRVNNHYAILRLVGVCDIPPGSEMDTSTKPSMSSLGGVAIVTEYCERGNLQQLFYRNEPLCMRDSIDRIATLKMMMDAAAGVLHLHSADVVHRDLACRNLLADQKMRVFVADFGFARVKERCRGGGENGENGESKAGYSTNNVGPIRWEAPEVWKSDRLRKYSSRTDVYSFGICLWEICIGEKPFARLSNHEVIFQVMSGSRPPFRQRLMDLRRQGKDESEEENGILDQADQLLVSLVESCWLEDPKARPTMASVLDTLNSCHDIMLEEAEQKNDKEGGAVKKEDRPLVVLSDGNDSNGSNEEYDELYDAMQDNNGRNTESSKTPETLLGSGSRRISISSKEWKNTILSSVAAPASAAPTPVPPPPPPPPPPKPTTAALPEDTSDAGAGSQKQPEEATTCSTPVSSGWTCEACTLHNLGAHLCCLVCRTERPTSWTSASLLEHRNRTAALRQDIHLFNEDKALENSVRL